MEVHDCSISQSVCNVGKVQHFQPCFQQLGKCSDQCSVLKQSLLICVNIIVGAVQYVLDTDHC